MRLVGRIREAFESQIPVRVLYAAPTVESFARHLDDKEGQVADGCIVPLRGSGKKRPLFCLPPAGSLPWCYAGLMRYIDSEHPVLGLQAPDSTDDAGIDDEISYYVAAIRDYQPQGPYHLIGWSIGGLMAHAVGTKLQELGHVVSLVAIIDAYPESASDEFDLEFVPESLVGKSVEEVFQTLGFSDRYLGLPLTRDSKENGNYASGINDCDTQTIRRILQSLRRSELLARAYRPQVFRGDLMFFRAAVPLSSDLQQRWPSNWSAYLTGSLDVYDISADHFHMLDPEFCSVIGQEISKRLVSFSSSPLSNKAPSLDL